MTLFTFYVNIKMRNRMKYHKYILITINCFVLHFVGGYLKLNYKMSQWDFVIYSMRDIVICAVHRILLG